MGERVGEAMEGSCRVGEASVGARYAILHVVETKRGAAVLMCCEMRMGDRTWGDRRWKYKDWYRLACRNVDTSAGFLPVKMDIEERAGCGFLGVVQLERNIRTKASLPCR